jgi:CubicO group peptidase (beta-lactamase class C family)
MKASLWVSLAALSALTPLVRTQEPDLVKRVDAVFAEWDRPDSPGVAVGVIRDGELIHARGYGMANLEHDVALSPSSVLRIGSTSKQFSALCMLLLEDDGRISLNDEIHQYFPEFQDYGAPVTIRHLIHHTSGIRDYLTLMSLVGKRGDDFYTDDDVVEMLARQSELNFAPGDQHLYSNSGYFLLSQIVLRVTGRTMREYGQEKIFGPLGMADTHFHDDHTMVVPNRAAGYSSRPEGGFRINMTTLDMVGDGGIFTTVGDLLLWDRNFYANKLGGEDLVDRQLTTGVLNDGTQLTYANGLTVSRYRGLKVVRHGGSFVGFRAEMIRFPDQKFSVICLANLSSISPSRLANQVADIYLEDAFTEAPRQRTGTQQNRQRPGVRAEPASLSHVQLAEYGGSYYSPELDVVYTVSAGEGGLTLSVGKQSVRRLVPDGADVLRAGNRSVRFQRGDDRGITGFLLDAGRVRNLRFEKR